MAQNLLPPTTFAPPSMALPTAAPERQLKHRRSIDVQIYARDNGVWEVDARITDVKPRDMTLGHAVRPAGSPIHDMHLRLVLDEHANVLEAGSHTEAMPYPGLCDEHGDAYRQLVGLNLLNGFRRDVNARLGGSRGCTHLTELTRVLPTALVQAFAGEVIDTDGGGAEAKRPFQIDGCHALRADSPAVREFYPRWYQSSPVRADGPAAPFPPLET